MQRKATIRRIEQINRSGTKNGRDWVMDMTQVTIELPVKNATMQGLKEVTYQYGDHTNYEALLKELDGRMPLECTLEVDMEIDDYGREQTVIKGVQVPPVRQQVTK